MLSSKQANLILVFIIIFSLVHSVTVIFGVNIFDRTLFNYSHWTVALFIGLTYALVALQTGIALRRRSLRKWVMPAVTLFFGGVFVIELLASFFGDHPQKWPSLVNIVSLIVPIIALIFIWMPSKTKRVSTAKEEGTVKWFHHKKGYGFINRPEGEDLFVHYRGIDSSNKEQGHRVLKEGQRVTYYVEKGVRGLQAKDVTIVG